jgi:hypothetical protein
MAMQKFNNKGTKAQRPKGQEVESEKRKAKSGKPDGGSGGQFNFLYR